MPSSFAYVIFIKTTPERLWSALTDRAFTERYWFGAHLESAWSAGAAWRIVFADGRVADTGTLLECDPPRRMVIAWQNEFMPDLKAEGPSRCTIALEPVGETVRLSITHEIDREGSKLIAAVSGGWPKILSNLKSLIETGETILSGTGTARAG